jgi:hypothetical protein
MISGKIAIGQWNAKIDPEYVDSIGILEYPRG